jgi:hypothetical protein
MQPIQLIPPEQRECPFLRKPCIRHKCMLWVHYDRERDAVESCALTLLPYILAQAVVEQIRTVASIDQAREAGTSAQEKLAAALQALARAAFAVPESPRRPIGPGGSTQ